VERILNSAGKLFTGFKQIAWQNYCRLCNSVISEDENHFCSNCWQSLQISIVDSYCTRCGKELSVYGRLPGGCGDCRNINFQFDSIACAGIYKPPLSNLIIKFKLADRTTLLEPLLDIAQNAVFRAEFYQETDFIVSVPLHWLRRFQRGFNQSALIAKGLNLGDAQFNTDLVRIRYTKEQGLLSAYKRQKNIEGAFAVRKGHNFKGKNICLVDDVKTTGATLNECAKVLKQAGANKVFALVLAVAGQKDI